MMTAPAYYELEDFPIGAVVLTPSGRRAIVKKHLTGASKRDAFSRILCRYEGATPKDLVTLQPYQLRPVIAGEDAAPCQCKECQMCLKNESVIDTYHNQLTVITAADSSEENTMPGLQTAITND